MIYNFIQKKQFQAKEVTMQVIDRLYKGYRPLYPIEEFCPVGKALFIDIETTGLKKETTSLYLIGCGHYTDEGFATKLFFAETGAEEALILSAFDSFARSFTHLFHFNGNKFDIPYLLYKAGLYDMDGFLKDTVQIDIYRLCKPLRYLLFPETMRQKAIEEFLGIGREDKYTGGELIEVYQEYEKRPTDQAFCDLITHNREDVLGMHNIMPILYYLSFKDAPLSYVGYHTNRYSDYAGNEHEEVIFEYRTDISFPRSFTAKTETMYVKASCDDGKILIRLPIYVQEMKIYFDNYRDYCYLPEEDTAILKTLAYSLPKGRYQKATRDTAYQRVSGTFLKQPHSLFRPVLCTDRKDKKKYFRFPEDFNKEAAEEFGRSLINIFFSMKRTSST
ncbi:MAG: ribonuclease H-like domain-containing protein [Lachnospiraceae bacterium]|nr:ribonuclease H-like domain-containing protein [Lachnospiraceae bacterium]